MVVTQHRLSDIVIMPPAIEVTAKETEILVSVVSLLGEIPDVRSRPQSKVSLYVTTARSVISLHMAI